MVWHIKIEQINRTEKVYKTPEELKILSDTIIKEFDKRENEHNKNLDILQEIKEQCSH